MEEEEEEEKEEKESHRVTMATASLLSDLLVHSGMHLLVLTEVCVCVTLTHFSKCVVVCREDHRKGCMGSCVTEILLLNSEILYVGMAWT